MPSRKPFFAPAPNPTRAQSVDVRQSLFAIRKVPTARPVVVVKDKAKNKYARQSDPKSVLSF